MTAVTAITAQNTIGVTAVHNIPPKVILAQVRAVLDDIGVDAVKIGMLGNVATIEAVAEALTELASATPVVLDPVMVSESGAQLLDPSARTSLIVRLLPRASVATPNVPEARALLDDRQADADGRDVAHDPDRAEHPDVPALARAVLALGPAAVVITGGHRDRATDIFYDGAQMVELPGERFPDGAAHGSGCTHSSVLAARLAWGDEPLEAARVAKRLAAGAVANGLVEIGAGTGPVDVLGLADRG